MHHWGFVQCWGLNPGRPSHTLGKYSQLGYHLQPWGKLCFQEFLSSRNLHLLKLARLQESHPSQWSSQRWRLGPLRTVALLPRATPVREIKQGLGHTGRLPRGLAGAPPSPPSSQTKHHHPLLEAPPQSLERHSLWVLASHRSSSPISQDPRVPFSLVRGLLSPGPGVPFSPQVPTHFSPVFPGASPPPPSHRTEQEVPRRGMGSGRENAPDRPAWESGRRGAGRAGRAWERPPPPSPPLKGPLRAPAGIQKQTAATAFPPQSQGYLWRAAVPSTGLGIAHYGSGGDPHTRAPPAAGGRP